MFLKEWKPSAPRVFLFGLAGLLWSSVGGMLCGMAYDWLMETPGEESVIMGAAGCLLAIVAYRTGFSGIARKNMERIHLSPERPCVFSFQAWKSYLTVAVMVGFGVLLRSSPISKTYLAVVYLMMGGGLFLASFHYYVRLWDLIWKGAETP